MRTIRTTAIAAAATLALLVPTTALAQDTTVAVGDSSFNPDTVTIAPGGTVTWEVSSSLPHTITAEDGSFDESVSDGDTFEHTFDEAGTYAYYCEIHGGPDGVGMAGTVVVEAAQEGEPTEAPTPTETDTEDAAPPTTGSITVSDQEGDGTAVVVDEVTIEGAGGFVVVHADEDGAPGPVLGHAPIDEGTTTALSVPMDAPLTEDQTVWPMLHVDAGTLGTYEFPGADGPVTVDGQVVMEALAYTVVTADATEQPTDGELATTGRSATIPLLVAGLLAIGLGGLALRSRRST